MMYRKVVRLVMRIPKIYNLLVIGDFLDMKIFEKHENEGESEVHSVDGKAPCELRLMTIFDLLTLLLKNGLSC